MTRRQYVAMRRQEWLRREIGTYAKLLLFVVASLMSLYQLIACFVPALPTLIYD